MFEGILKNIGKLFSDDEDKEPDTVSAHYGMKEDSFKRLRNKMIADMITHDKFSDSLDINFKEFSGEQRTRIFAYAVAFSDYYDFKESRKAMSK